MATRDYSMTDRDREIFANELQDFVPAKVFDAHCHIWDESSANDKTANSPLRYNTTAKDLLAYNAAIFPGRELGFLFLPTPVVGMDFAADRAWCGSQTGVVPNSANAAAIAPGIKPDDLARDIEKYHFKALKPYLLFSTGVPYNSRIGEFVPEELVEVANHYKLTIVLHMSKPLCASDPDNLKDLAYYTTRYPDLTWQLAHCARNFQGHFMEKSIDALRRLDHIVYDLSAVCNDYTYYLLFKHEDKRRLFYGTDNIVAGGDHDIYAPYAYSWGGVMGGDEARKRANCILLCLEALRCLRRGAIMADVTQSELEDIFYNNAARHYKI